VEANAWSGWFRANLFLASWTDANPHALTIHDGIRWGWDGACTPAPTPGSLALLGRRAAGDHAAAPVMGGASSPMHGLRSKGKEEAGAAARSLPPLALRRAGDRSHDSRSAAGGEPVQETGEVQDVQRWGRGGPVAVGVGVLGGELVEKQTKSPTLRIGGVGAGVAVWVAAAADPDPRVVRGRCRAAREDRRARRGRNRGPSRGNSGGWGLWPGSPRPGRAAALPGVVLELCEGGAAEEDGRTWRDAS